MIKPSEMNSSARKILIVDDEQNMRIALFESLTRVGYDVSVAENGRMALELMGKNLPDLVITDIKMPEMDGIALLGEIHERYPEVGVVVITGYASVETAVAAMKNGAIDYILKPFPVEVMEDTVNRVFAASSPVPASSDGIEEKQGSSIQGRPIIGNNSKLLQLMQRSRSVAQSKATVLILGESGTGKEIFARLIHNESDRAAGPFVALNCAALPEGLLESELFGHEKGAFTGAIVSKKGKFELADGGTLLLDEIGEIPLHLQAKLLRVLQEEEVDRVGGKAPVKIDVRVVATTNRDLEEAAKKGEFRQDLYYRLNVIPLRLPPLRERKDDILLLVDFFIEKYSRRYGKQAKKLSNSSQARFLEYSWPGNIREMENLVERAVLLSAGASLELWDFWDDVEAPSFDAAASQPAAISAIIENLNISASSIDIGEQTLKDVERQMILQALQKTDNNRTHAAKILGISVRTLRNKLHEYRTQGIMVEL